jgi:hypothetical protein
MNYLIYNTCGLSGKETSRWYIQCIETILGQKGVPFRVCLSSCLNSDETVDRLVKHFGQRISYNLIRDKIPVNTSMNHSVLKMVEYFGPANSYGYIDSGAFFLNENSLKRLVDVHDSGPYGMVASNAQSDNGYWLLDNEVYRVSPYIIPIERACHPHIQLHSNRMFNYFGKVWPDIFASFCSESIFTVLCRSIGTHWVTCSDVMVGHDRSVDGPSSGFLCEQSEVLRKQADGKGVWSHTFRTKRTMKEIVFDPAYVQAGGLFECCQGILMPDLTKYDENGFAKDPTLKEYLRDNFFLKKDEFDYDQVAGEFIP